MKRHLLLLLVSLLPILANAYDAQINGIYYNFSGNGAIVTFRNTSYNSYSGTVVIPESVTYNGKTYSVTSIDQRAFYGCTGLTYITIPGSVTSIGNHAFKGCSSLTSVNIPNSVTSIGNYAFEGCSSLTSVTIPNGVTNIGNYIFRDCVHLISVTIPNSVTSIGSYAFSDCSSLTSVNIPNSVTSIGNYAFLGCSSLTSVTIPNGVTNIGNSTFAECVHLISVTIGSGVTSIGEMAFYGCTSLTSIIIPTSVTNIGDYAFYRCSSLTSINIPNNVTSIGQRAFYGCSKLTSVTILGEGTTIGDNAFVNCIKLGDIYCHSEVVPQTGSDIFSSTANITLHVPNVSIELYKNTSPWSSFGKIVGLYGSEYKLTYMLDGVEYKSYTLWEDQSVTPEPAPTKEGHTFSGWSGLPATMPNHDVIVTGTFTINSYTLTYKVDGAVYKTMSVVYGTKPTPEPALTKEGHTFSGWSGLPETMPAHDVVVTGSFSINSYILTYKVDGEVYKTFTVVYGTTLSPITEPTKTGHTFSGWTGLPTTMPARDVEVTGSFNVNSYTLTYKVDGNVYKTFYVPYGSAITPIEAPVKKGMTFSGWGNVPETMPAYNVTLTGTNSWAEKTVNGVIYQVTDTLINYVSVIGSESINETTEILPYIEIGGDVYEVRTIGINAFRNCYGITTVIIPEGIMTIGNNAFYGCSTLSSITIPGSVTSIGDNAFYGCNNIKFYVSRSSSYAMLYVWNYGTDPYESGTNIKLYRPTLSSLSTTQTTITYGIANMYPGFEYEVEHESVGENAYLITGLRPSYTQNVPLRVYYEDNSYSTSAKLATSPISPTVISNNITASSISVGGSYIKGDANVVSSSLTVNGNLVEGTECKIHGLKPNTSYNCKYKVVVEYGDGETYTYEDSKDFRTASLTLATQQPKVINAGNAIVAAESNLDDEETKVGFEWRRTDWTSEFESNSGVAYLYDGKMEGYIRNLYTEKLWKYRPYYESDSGNRYYGDWVGIDPTNTSYFEPTVHTYAQINVTGNRAEVKGYAMRGTDNVTSQGFMYWQNNTSVSLRRRAASVPGGATVVNASGNIMTATLEDLEYEATYNYVAFVTTSEGETFYGEMQTFSTSADPDGIEGVKASEEVTEVARYDIQGRMIAKPQKGINIIRYSDGTTKKVLIK